MEPNRSTFIGERSIAGYPPTPFGVASDARRYHCILLGRTGMGKSTLIKRMAAQDIAAGEGVAVLDPHGDLVEELLEHIPPHRSDDVVYFNLADFEHPVGLNILSGEGSEPHLMVSAVVSAFKHIWGDSWGPRMEYIFAMALSAIAGREDSSLLGVHRLLADDRYREHITASVTDPVVRKFWQEEFEGYNDRFRSEAVAPIQNKLGRVLMAAPLRNVLGQVAPKLDIDFVVNNRRIFLANLSRGELGEDKSSLIGALLVSQFQLAAMRRAALPERDRTDFFLHVDEFPTFASDAFVEILSELRKYKISMTIAAQYLESVRPTVRAAMLGNAGTMISFSVGPTDAEILEPYFDPRLARELVELGPHEIFVSSSSGEVRASVSGRTLPPSEPTYGRRDALVRLSREKYSQPRSLVEEKIERWLG